MQITTTSGSLTAHAKSCLVLLCSQPDTVHRHSLRKTEYHHHYLTCTAFIVYLF